MLTISPEAPDAVRIGTTVSQVQAGAGLAFDGSGDGYSYRTSIPSGLYLYVGGDPVTCVGATAGPRPGSAKQTARTPEGFQLGQSVPTLLGIYGSRAKLVTTATGIDPGSAISSPSLVATSSSSSTCQRERSAGSPPVPASRTRIPVADDRGGRATRAAGPAPIGS